MKIRSILSLLAFSILIFTCIAGHLHYSAVKDAAFKKARHAAERRLGKIVNHIDLPLNSYSRMVEILAGLPAMRAALRQKDRKTLEDANFVLDLFQDDPRTDVCYLMDADGTTLASSNRGDAASFVGKNYAFRPYFRNALQGAPVIYMALGVTSGKRGMYFSHPVYRDEWSKPIGVVVAKTTIEEIEKGIRETRRGIVALTSPEGVVFISNRDEWLYYTLWKATPGQIVAISETRQFGSGPWTWSGVSRTEPAEAVDKSGARYNVHRRKIDAFPGWTLFYLYDHRGIFDGVFNELFRTSSYVFLMLCFLITMLAGFLHRKGSFHILERGKAEKALEESEKKYRNVVENAVEAIIVAQDGKFRFFNRKMVELSGYSEEELLDRDLVELIHPEDRLAAMERYQARTEGKELPTFFQLRVMTSDGDVRWAETTSVLIDWRGRPAVLAFITDITARKRAEEALRENEAYLKTIMSTIQAGIMVTAPDDGKIVDVNPFAARLIGRPPGELLGARQDAFMEFGEGAAARGAALYKEIGDDDGVLRSVSGNTYHIRRSKTEISRQDRTLILQSFNDITDINELLNKQEINIDLASRLLHLVDAAPPRRIELPGEARMFTETVSAPCYTLGGDHFFARTLPGDGAGGPARTVISLKDQSGHAVGGVLKSIITDLIHHNLIGLHPSASLEKTISRLNDEICVSGILGGEDFFTSINLEIEHDSRRLRYVSTGHPAFLMIRGGKVVEEQKQGTPGANMPIGFQKGRRFSAGEVRLEVGDKLILYTDGLTEMPVKRMDKRLSYTDLKGLVEKIVGEDPEASVSEIIAVLLKTVADISGERVEPFSKNTSDDDVTLIGLEIEDVKEFHESIYRPGSSREISDVIRSMTRSLENQWLLCGFESPETRLGPFLEEALLNAWLHGNQRDPDKRITVRYNFGNDFMLEVMDEGAGVDVDRVPDPRRPENLGKSTGRGIFIMRRLADDIHWKDGGRHMTAFFRRRPASKKIKSPRAIHGWSRP